MVYIPKSKRDLQGQKSKEPLVTMTSEIVIHPDRVTVKYDGKPEVCRGVKNVYINAPVEQVTAKYDSLGSHVTVVFAKVSDCFFDGENFHCPIPKGTKIG